MSKKIDLEQFKIRRDYKKSLKILKDLLPKGFKLPHFDLKANKQLPQPKHIPIQQPEILSDRVLSRIQQAGEKARIEGKIAWSGNQITLSIRSMLNSFERLAALVPRVLAREPGAETEFRDWLSGNDELSETIRWEPELGLRGPIGSPCKFPSLVTFGDLLGATILITKDEKDFRGMQNRIRGFFPAIQWAESLRTAADHFELTGDINPFASRVQLFSRQKILLEGNPGGYNNPGFSGSAGLGKDRWGDLPPLDKCSNFRAFCFIDLMRLVNNVFITVRALFMDINTDYLLSDQITSVTPHTCSGDEIIIQGEGFGNFQPEGIHLLLPCEIPGITLGAGETVDDGLILPEHLCRIAEVPEGQWFDTEIRLPCPDWARSGPIGFLDEAALTAAAVATQLIGENLESYYSSGRDRDEYNPCWKSRGPSFAEKKEPVIGCPPDTGSNFFGGTIPEIYFEGDAILGDMVVQPGDVITINWKVRNADEVIITKGGYYQVYGPDVDSTPISGDGGGTEVTGSFTLDFTGILRDGEAIYFFNAEGPCGPKQRVLTFHVRKPTTVSILGIEVTQVIQNLVFNDPAASNLIPLFAGKNTLVRVYIDSGRSDGYNSGTLSSVTGLLTLEGLDGQGSELRTPYPQTMSARTPTDIDRGIISHTLNFPLWFQGWDFSGKYRIKVQVFSVDEWAVWEPVENSIEVEIVPREILNLVIFRVYHPPTETTTTLPEIYTAIEKLETLLPLEINWYEEGTIEMDVDFEDDDPWHEGFMFLDGTSILDMVDEAAEDVPASSNTIFCAIIPDGAAVNPPRLGIAWAGGGDFWNGTDHRVAAWVSRPTSLSMTEGHEIGHALNLNHNTRNTGLFGIDLRSMYPGDVKPPTICTLMGNTRLTITFYGVTIEGISCSERWINPAEYLWLAGIRDLTAISNIVCPTGVSGTLLEGYGASNTSVAWWSLDC